MQTRIHETNPAPQGYAFATVPQASCYWTAPTLKMTRLRLTSDQGFPMWDVSYAHGRILTSEGWVAVEVLLPFHQVPKHNITGFILDWARKENVYARGMGILDHGIISKLF